MGGLFSRTISLWQVTPSLKQEQENFRKKAFHAAAKGSISILQELMTVPSCQGGIPLHAVVDERTGHTLLHVAFEKNRADCIRFLLYMGCDEKKCDHSMETPLHVACMNDALESLIAVLEFRKTLALELRDIWQRTLLFKALVYHSERVLQFLLSMQEQGAAVNCLSRKMRTPLQTAICSQNPEAVLELLRLGARTQCSESANAVRTAVSELMKRSQSGMMCDKAETILNLVLTAHGYPLHTDEPGVFQGLLVSADLKRFLSLHYKMHICSSTTSFDFLKNASETSLRQRTRMAASPKFSPLRLLDLARRVGRKSLMASGYNVVWAVERLQVAPGVKGLLLLKDCDHGSSDTNVLPASIL
ncbi:hypothetical protein C0Q70_21054 [Pomacea canaliculata]|uniref:Uncharacterized protein n=1 Tax=Pomacea canaliculata TaxID=400727 RepID=A0A2T7NBG7_POMCA|nr:hypothetical protein C0Q70_21054 [Pomacea canaliculata]